jgi:polyisoprenoid-binding protein YceI
MMLRVRFLILSFFILLSNGLDAQEFLTENGKTLFISKAPMTEFTGASEQLQGLIDLDKNLLDFFIDLNTLKTGIGLRDRHMRENYLETKKYPFAEFTGKIAAFPELLIGEEVPVSAKGKFKIHGVEREIEVPGTLQRKSDRELVLKAEFKVLLGDYNIDIPKVMFYELAEDQIVKIDAILKKK